VFLEDDFFESGSAGNLSKTQSAIGTPSFVNNPNLTRVWLLINRLAVVSTYGGQFLVAMGLESGEHRTGWKIINSAIPAEPRRVTGQQ
jgi:hypothetical protein